jgi:hypothetical protein
MGGIECGMELLNSLSSLLFFLPSLSCYLPLQSLFIIAHFTSCMQISTARSL